MKNAFVKLMTVTAASLLTSVSSIADTTTHHWVSGYYVGYEKDLYPASAIDFTAISHLMVGRIVPTKTGGLVKTFDIDATNGPIMAQDLSARAHAAGRKAILMVGGAGEHAGWVGAASSANRNTFVNNLLSTMDAYGYDGLDLDWEPVSKSDQPLLQAVAQQLRTARPNIILTIPIGWISKNSPHDASPFFGTIASLFDQMNIMSYDMASGDWGWDTWHSSALTGAGSMTPSAISVSVSAWRKAGIPSNKLGIGMGFYGSCWRGVTAPHQATAGVDTGGLPLMGNSDGEMSFANIMNQYYSAANYHWDTIAKVPYLSSTTPMGPQKCNFISYENPQSIKAKGAYVDKQLLGGTIIWTINQGYMANQPLGQRDPVLQAVKAAFRP